MTPAPHPDKTRARKTTRAVGSAVTWADVLRVLPTEDGRSSVVVALRTAGFSPDDFAHTRIARETVADALTRREDTLGSRADVERQAIRAVRRRLEWELWP